jgi:hypothetical protein
MRKKKIKAELERCMRGDVRRDKLGEGGGAEI